MLALASRLSDDDLLARVGVLAVKEREASAELVAHLAELEVRPSLYAAQGHGSLFSYRGTLNSVDLASPYAVQPDASINHRRSALLDGDCRCLAHGNRCRGTA